MTTYQPGDRVRYHETRHIERTGQYFKTVPENTLGTVVSSGEYAADVEFDNGRRSVVYLENIEPKPVEIGDWVRYELTVNQQIIGKVAELHNIDGEPSESEGAVDCAIRIMTRQLSELASLRNELKNSQTAIAEAAELLRTARPHIPGWLDRSDEWLTKHAPPPAFKRGDRVEFIGKDSAVETGTRGRIVSHVQPHHGSIEVMFYMTKGDSPKFINVARNELQLAP